jgi:hypothetical protein
MCMSSITSLEPIIQRGDEKSQNANTKHMSLVPLNHQGKVPNGGVPHDMALTGCFVASDGENDPCALSC